MIVMSPIAVAIFLANVVLIVVLVAAVRWCSGRASSRSTLQAIARNAVVHTVVDPDGSLRVSVMFRDHAGQRMSRDYRISSRAAWRLFATYRRSRIVGRQRGDRVLAVAFPFDEVPPEAS